MYRYLFFITILGLVSCSETRDDSYYRLHPKELQKTISLCEQQKAPESECARVHEIGTKLGQLVFDLQKDPQGFGKRIMNLQNTIVDDKKTISQNGNNSQLNATLHTNLETLADYLAVVKWLESPES